MVGGREDGTTTGIAAGVRCLLRRLGPLTFSLGAALGPELDAPPLLSFRCTSRSSTCAWEETRIHHNHANTGLLRPCIAPVGPKQLAAVCGNLVTATPSGPLCEDYVSNGALGPSRARKSEVTLTVTQVTSIDGNHGSLVACQVGPSTKFFSGCAFSAWIVATASLLALL